MKPKLIKRPALYALAALLLAAVIYSCKKELQQNSISATAITNPAVMDARNWYENSYPQNGDRGTIKSNSNGSSTTDFSQLVKPYWDKANTYTRFGESVVEIPIEPSNNLNFMTVNTSNGEKTDINNSRSSFLLLKMQMVIRLT